MSRLDNLIAQHCPSGVFFRDLVEVAGYSTTRVDAADLDATSFVGVDNLLPNKQGKNDATYLPNTERLTAYREGDVLLGNIRPYLKKVWLATDGGGCSGDVLVLRIRDDTRAGLMPEYFFYVMSSDRFFDYSMQHAKGAKMPRGDKLAILRYRFPVPPLEVQREIVRILDTFTELEAELEAELQARRRQYERLRAALLAPREGITWGTATVGGVCRKVSAGATPLVTRDEFYSGGTIPWLRTQEVRYRDIFDTDVKITDSALKESSIRLIPTNCVIVALSGAGVTRGRVAVNRIPVTTNQHCCSLEVDEQLAHHRYVYYWLIHHYEELRRRGQGNRSDLNLGIVKNFPIRLPPLAEQRRIAALLDRIDTLVNDLSVGLPAELAARRRQYEHYRDRLLTFGEAVS